MKMIDKLVLKIKTLSEKYILSKKRSYKCRNRDKIFVIHMISKR